MSEHDAQQMRDETAAGVYPPGGGKWRTPLRREDVRVRALPTVRFAHVDQLTGITLATFDSCEEALEALALVGPLADVDIDAIFGGD